MRPLRGAVEPGGAAAPASADAVLRVPSPAIHPVHPPVRPGGGCRGRLVLSTAAGYASGMTTPRRPPGHPAPTARLNRAGGYPRGVVKVTTTAGRALIHQPMQHPLDGAVAGDRNEPAAIARYP